jgi:quinol monooxygenase YgiN
MYIVHVSVHVLPEHIEAFKSASALNAEASRKEPGVVRFDVIQSHVDATRFVLVEIYRDERAPLAHKETEHYALWRDTVEPMMKSPRTSEKFSNVSPTDAEWR